MNMKQYGERELLAHKALMKASERMGHNNYNKGSSIGIGEWAMLRAQMSENTRTIHRNKNLLPSTMWTTQAMRLLQTG